MDVEWRRDDPSPPDGAPDGASAALTEFIRDEIEGSGPVTFEAFMQRALYDPLGGYYTTATTRPTREGDFLTAPELHPIFGRALASQVDEMWRRLGRTDGFTMREFGAGSGALFLSIVDGLARIDSPLASTIRYEPVDFARQRAVIVERLGAAGRAEQLVPTGERLHPLTGIAVANEFLDALPVHRVINVGGTLREIYVDWRDDQFTEVAGPLTDDRILAWFADSNIELAENQRAEVNLAMLDWLARTATEIERGYILAIDYGAGAADLYGTSRPTGTIRSFSAQRVSSDVLTEPGSRDITSHVDFDALERQARASGLDVGGRRKSNEFLLACGLDDAYAQARVESDQDWDEATGLRSAIQRLLDPNALGGYLVSVLAKDAPTDPPLRGLAPLARRR